VATRSRRNKAVSLPKASAVAEPLDARFPSASAGARARYLVALALAVITVALYWPVHSYGFFPCDDGTNVQTNPYLNPLTPTSFAYLWTHPYANLYIPVAYTVFALVGLFARGPHGYLPGPFHTADLALHVVNVLLVYAILLRFVPKAWASGLGAALFAVHPEQVGVVAWITETRGLSSAFFALISILAYLHYAQAGPKTRSRDFTWWIAGTACFALALLAKPSAVAVPVIAAALDLWLVRRRAVDVAKSAGPWAILAVVIVLVTSTAQPVQKELQLALWQRLVVMFDSLAFYTGKIFAPWQIAFDYGRSSPSVVSHAWGFENALVGFGLVAFIIWLGRGRPWVWACAATFGAMILPVSGLAPFDFQLVSSVADRYFYLALLGPSLALAIILGQARPGLVSSESWADIRPAPAAACLIVLIALAAASWQQVQYWRNPYVVLARAAQLSPNAWWARENLSTWFDRHGQPAKAYPIIVDAVRLGGHDAQGYGDMGRILAELGRGEESVVALQKAIDLEPPVPVPGTGIMAVNQSYLSDTVALATVLAGLGRRDEAIDQLNEAMREAPTYTPVRDELTAIQSQAPPPAAQAAEKADQARQLFSAGQRDQALALWKEALALDPHSVQAHADLGVALYELGRAPEAVSQLRVALALAPGDLVDRMNLGKILLAGKNRAGAIEQFQEVLRLNPNDADARTALGQATAVQP